MYNSSDLAHFEMKKCLNARHMLGTRSHSVTLTVSQSLTLVILNNFCFHVYAQKSLTHSHTHTLSHSHTIPDGPRSPLPNWILAIFLVQFFNQTRVIFSSLVCYLFIAALASPWLL